MIGSSSSRTQALRFALALLASSAVFTAGCANFATTASGSVAGDAATATGKVHGGNQPVAGAVVKLWYVGAPTKLGATTTTAADGTGSFSFIKAASYNQTEDTSQNTFSCPTVNTLVYVVATGGNTLNNGNSAVSNSASVFIAPFGICGNIGPSTFVDMTEVTTVATMAALQQYFNPLTSSTVALPAESFGITGTGLSQQAATNAFAIIPTMVSAATGTAVTSKVITNTLGVGTGASATSVTATPESAKINLIANIISSCINNANNLATNCNTLFNNAAPPDPTVTNRPYGTVFPTATDTLQAVYYMLTNPTDGNSTRLANLFNLSPATGAPYQPSLASAPSDWTIAISYSSTSTCGANNKHLINSVQDLAVDFFGGIWLANFETGGNLTQINSDGQPFTCIAIGTGANTGVTVDSTPSLAHIWLADSGASNVYNYTPGGTTFTTVPSVSAPLAIAADGTGNIYYTSSASTSLYELPQAAGATAAVTPVVVSNAVGSTPAHVFLDLTTAGAPSVWTTSGSTFITHSRTAAPNTAAGYTNTAVSGLPTPTYGISVTAKPSGSSNNFVYVGSAGVSNTISNLTGNATTAYTPVTGFPVTGLQGPAAVATDGAQNVWAINNTPGANSVVEIGLALQQISPTTGFAKSSAYLGNGRSLVIDPSGNVWIGLDGSNSITEIVGAAVPVYQPYSYALKSINTFQVNP